MAARTNIAIHGSANTAIHSKARINRFVMGSWTAVMLLCLAFWAGVISLFMGI